MALLPPEALGLEHGDPGHADLVQRLLHLVELEGLYDGFDLLLRLLSRTCAGVSLGVSDRRAQAAGWFVRRCWKRAGAVQP
jgi:hypothetical protein